MPEATARTIDLKRESTLLGERLVRCLPAASFEMETLVRLAGIEASREIASAAVTCEGRPRMLLNPDFVGTHCQSDEHLFLLAMHELWHVLLAHTTLYPRATAAENIAFDAVINAGLCRQFPGPEYRGFFEALNPEDAFPGLLLRPPPGWPEKPRLRRKIGPPGTVELLRRLYPPRNAPHVAMPLYAEILELLASAVEGEGEGEGASGLVPGHADAGAETLSPVLLGNHESEEQDAEAADDAHFGEVVRRIVASWPPPPIPLGGRDAGRPTGDWLCSLRPAPEAARRSFSRVLRRVLGHVPGHLERKRRITIRSQGGLGPLLNGVDRLSPARRALGLPDILHPQPVDLTVRSRQTPCSAHVYLDVSGSMLSLLPHLAGLLAPYVVAGQVRLFQFSTGVYPLTLPDLKKGRLTTEFGTDIKCVLEHALAEPRLRRALILTDGYVGRPPAGLARAVADRSLRIHAVFPAESAYSGDLAELARSLTTLPPLSGVQRTRRPR
ncbi:MAG: VWA domain-containing protein [Deltaproteobacteria bacterium]|nr:VWA domain-containing protein [Deltaproteobacteria bacterium]